MSIKMVTAEEQYKKYPQIDRNEVLKILEWFEKQPHLPKVTGTTGYNVLFWILP